MADQTKTLAWRLIVETEGIERNTRKAANSLADLGKAAQRMGTFIRASIASQVVMGFVRLTDEYKNMQNRIKLVTSSTEEMRTVQARLLEVANRTRTDVADTVELYGRSARSLKAFGLSQKEIIGFTETVSQAIQVSGATAKEASQGVIQFSQGLASGRLAGDELRAVLEQMPRLGRAIAEGMGVSYGALRKLGSEGKLTTKALLDALQKEAPKLATEFASMGVTVAQGWTVMTNEMKNLVGSIDEILGTSKGLGAFFQAFGEGLHGRSEDIKEFTLDVREFVMVATIALTQFFENLPDKMERFRLSMAGTLGEIFGSDTLVESAIERTAAIDKALEQSAKNRETEFDEIRASMAKLREELLGANANLDEHGKATEGAAQATDQYLKLLDSWNQKNQALIDSLDDLKAEQFALTIQTKDGKIAAAQWLAITKARSVAHNEIREVLKTELKLTDAQIDAFLELSEAVARANNALSARKNQIQLMEELTKATDAFKESVFEANAKNHALTIEIQQGAEAAADWIAVTQARSDAMATLAKWYEEGIVLTDEAHDAFLREAEAAAMAARGVEKNADAWEVVNGAIGDTHDSFETAALELEELHKALDKVGKDLTPAQVDAIKMRIRELGVEASDTATLAKDSLNTVIQGFADFLMEGTFDVKKFVKSMIQELGRLIVQMMITRALKNSVLGSAQGNVFAGGALVPFAQGGVVTGPTTFPMSGGRTGLMGEAGPEAVMPLARLPSGDLGVRSNPAKIELINKTGVQATARIQRTADRMSVILEAAELGASMAESRMTRSMRSGYGATSAALQRTYALRRQG